MRITESFKQKMIAEVSVCSDCEADGLTEQVT